MAAALVLCFHWRLLLPDRAIVDGDFRALFIPLRAGLQRMIAAREWPFWQRGMLLGYPLAGDPQAQLYNPLTWLTLPLGPARGVTLQSLCELCIASVGMARWMRARGLRPVEGLFAGACFALSLKESVHLHHATFAATTCAWPWMFAGLDARKPALAAVATCFAWFGGAPQLAYFGCGLAFIYSIYLKDLRLIWSIPLGTALAAPLLLPAAELSALGPRGEGLTYHYAASWAWHDRAVWELMLLPRAWGGRAAYRGPLNFWEAQGYFGLLPMALFAAAPLQKRGNWLFAAAIALALWLSFGEMSWLRLHWLFFKALPGYGSFRVPTRALMLAALCASLLAAEGLHRLRDEPAIRPRVFASLAALAVCVALAAALPGGYLVHSLREDAEAAFWLLAASALFVARPRWACAAVAIFVADAAVQERGAIEIGSARSENHALDEIRQEVPAQGRVAVLAEWGAENNATFAHGWEGVTGYSPAPLDDVRRLFDATWTGALRPREPLDTDPGFPRYRPESPLVALFAAPLLVSSKPVPHEFARRADLRLANQPALPRVFWTSAWTTQVELEAAARGDLAMMQDPLDFESSPHALVPASGLRIRSNALSANLDAPADGLAVILDPLFPGWHATLDGRPVPLLKADVAFEAVRVPKGQHRLELRYFPARLLLGLLVAALSAAQLIFLCHWTSRRVDRGSPGG